MPNRRSSARGTRLAGVLLACSLMLVPAHSRGQTQAHAESRRLNAVPPVLATNIASCNIKGADLAEALHRLRARDVSHVVIGFERVPHRAGAKGRPITLKLTNTTVGEIIRRLCQADPRYTYSVFHGYVVDVRPRGAEKDPADLLNIKITKYDLDANVSAGAAIEGIDEDAPELREFLRRKHQEWVKRAKPRAGGSMGSILSGNMPPPRLSLHLRNVTVREILNSLALASVNRFKEGKNYGPTGWEYDFVIDPNAPTGLGGYPHWKAF